jgi:hypothetical protein
VGPRNQREARSLRYFIPLMPRFSLASKCILETEIETIKLRQESDEDVHGYQQFLTSTPQSAVRHWNVRPLNWKPFSVGLDAALAEEQ